jgi:regulatory protein
VGLLSDIIVPRRGTRRRELAVDGEYWRSTSSDVVSALGLKAGRVTDADELAAAIAAAEPRAARDRALRLLAYRDRSAREILARLADDGYPGDVAAAAVDDLTDSGIMDDTRLAASAARNLTEIRRLGRVRALRELESRGLDRETASAALDETLPPDEEERAARALAGALAAKPRADVERVAVRLVRKGYSHSLALRIAREVMDDRAASDAVAELPSLDD